MRRSTIQLCATAVRNPVGRGSAPLRLLADSSHCRFLVASTIAFVILGVLASCASSQAPGRLTDEGFQSLHADYDVRYVEGAVGTFVGPDWSIDSFAAVRRGRRQVHRRGPGWSGPIRIDVDGDGSLDDIGNGHLYDLRLRRDDGALLWVRQVPLPAHLDEAGLDELGRLYARDLSLGRDAFVGESLIDEAERRSVEGEVRLVDEADLGVAGHAARGIVVRATRPPPRGVSREAYVLVRTSFTRLEHSALGERRFGTLLVIGYAGPHDERDLADLSRFLDAIRISRRSGS